MPKLRYWEIDLLRGVAIIGMVIYHFFFDLYYLDTALPVDPFSLPLILLARLTAIIFLFLVGFSFSLSQQKLSQQSFLVFYRSNLHRAVKVLLAASIVTLATFLIAPDLTVRFGILHLIAFSLLLLPLLSLIQKRLWLLPLSLSLIIIGLLPKSSPAVSSFDYFPLVPWFGVVLLGFILAQNYPQKRAALFAQQPPLISPLTTLSRHSLAIYLLHQPILFGILLLFKG